MFSYNITITHRPSGDVSTFYRVPFFKALAVMAYLRGLDNVVSYEVEATQGKRMRGVQQRAKQI